MPPRSRKLPGAGPLLRIGTSHGKRTEPASDNHPSLFGESSALAISTRQRDLLDAATAIEMEDARDAGAVGYAARLWAQLSLPYKDPGDAGLWIRRNGSLTLRVMPGMTGPKGAEKPGYPYGVLPRYILTWMSTEAVRTQSPVLQLGSNLSDFMDKLGLSPTGGKNGTITRLNDQMRRLLTSSMYVEDNRDDDSRWGIAGAHFSVASNYKLWYGTDDRAGKDPSGGPPSPSPTPSTNPSSAPPYPSTPAPSAPCPDHPSNSTSWSGCPTGSATSAAPNSCPGRQCPSNSAATTPASATSKPSSSNNSATSSPSTRARTSPSHPTACFSRPPRTAIPRR